jgi:hypothetical protein
VGQGDQVCGHQAGVIRESAEDLTTGAAMPAKTINIRSRDGGEFDCYLVMPEPDGPIPAIVLAATVHGVDADIRAIADEFAAHGLLPRRPTCSGVRFQGLFPTVMTAPRNGRSRA